MCQLVINFFSKRSRLCALFAILAAFATLYLGTNHLALWSSTALPLFNFEKNIPFLPWTVFVYLSVFVQVSLAILLFNQNNLGKTATGILSIIFLSGLIFALWPTHYPRPILPENTFWLTQIMYNFLIAVDTPKNCFPSQHIAACIFSFLSINRQNKILGKIFFIWTALIIISTLTLKQHYAVDIVGGLIVGVVIYFLLFNKKNNL